LLQVAYLNSLLRVGFDTLDFGSFVSPKAIPQMADTEDVIKSLNLNNSKSKLLAIVANIKGAENALKFSEIKYLGFPFSISETFQLRNTKKTLEQAFNEVKEIKSLANRQAEMVVYLGMGFGNPYGDPYQETYVMNWAEKFSQIGVNILSFADTIGVSNKDNIALLFQKVVPYLPQVEFGVHFHSNSATWLEKISTAYELGCRRFDSAMLGFGGCPLAKDELTGNIATENVIRYCAHNLVETGLDLVAFEEAKEMAGKLFAKYSN
jgi:hydroxymethylglutaryl-CoA lyase